MTTKTVSAPAPATTSAIREPRPFVWLQPAKALSYTAFRGVGSLRKETDHSRVLIVRALVDYSFRLGRRLDMVRRQNQPVSVVNRRRRAATLWINAILQGNTDAATMRNLIRNWLPQLSGTGPDATRAAARSGRYFIEFIRGLTTGLLFDTSADNLVPQARALNALDNILAIHLRAIQAAAAKRES